MFDIEQVQAQLRAAVRLSHESVSVPPFTCFFNPDNDATHANAAIPDESVGAEAAAALLAVAEAFRSHRRRPRFEYLEAYAPDLAALLEAHGYRCEMRSWLMFCVPETLHCPPWPAGLAVERLDDQTPLAVIQDLMTIQARSFGDPDAPRATAEEAQHFRTRFADLQLFVARLDGIAAGAASLTAPYNGIAELAGVATSPAFRRRGIAGAITYAVAERAFAQGVKQLFLTAASREAGRVYARAGFVTAGHGLAYVLPEEAEAEMSGGGSQA
jgi:N-acetylglutamate synthase-like GNAT family acetyltransferase